MGRVAVERKVCAEFLKVLGFFACRAQLARSPSYVTVGDSPLMSILVIDSEAVKVASHMTRWRAINNCAYKVLLHASYQGQPRVRVRVTPRIRQLQALDIQSDLIVAELCYAIGNEEHTCHGQGQHCVRRLHRGAQH